ncbi:hypothetical protein ACJMK2_024255 [Sinanodonta woodiana]|uniref:Uncharacterized protein n=1 Tax=Sinanodonta woodiana TaxID=1069815 RepID=A0ABD3T6U9_SINWO
MVVRILSPRIQWILHIAMCPWLLTYGHRECSTGETLKIVWCGESYLRRTSCNTVKCVQSDAESIIWMVALVRSTRCLEGKNPTYGFSNNYIWTTKCCWVLAGICYQEKQSTNNGQTSNGQASTMKTTNFYDKFTTPDDVFNSTETVDIVEQTEPTILETETDEHTGGNSVMTSTMKATKLWETSATLAGISNRTEQVGAGELLELNAMKKTETNNAMIGLYAGLPVGLFLFVLVLAVVCYIFRDKLKIIAGKFRKRHKEGLYQESGTTSEQYTGNDISRTFANQEYAMHGEQESHKSENMPTGVYDLCKSWPEPEQNGSFHHNPKQPEAKSSCSKYHPGYEELGIGEPYNAYDKIGEAADRGRFDPTYNHIHESNVSATDMRQGNKGGTEYDNAFI